MYALGVLLYELLTGTTAARPRSGSSRRRCCEMLRMIREEEPPRPSTRLSTTDGRCRRSRPAGGLEPAQLTRLVRGELDWIVMKALEKDRDRRYETANGLARDVQRYLADEPVEAVPAVGRATGCGSSSGGTGGRSWPPAWCCWPWSAGWSARPGAGRGHGGRRRQPATPGRRKPARAEAEARQRERAERALAEEARQRRQARQAVDDMYTQVAQKWLANEPRMQKVQREFLEKALRYYEELSREDGTDPAVRFETAKAFRRMGGMYQTLGQNARGAEAHARAAALLERTGRRIPGRARATAKSWATTTTPWDTSRCTPAGVRRRRNSSARPWPCTSIWWTISARTPASGNDLATTRHNLGNVLSGIMGGTSRPEEAKAAYRQAVALYKELVAAAPDSAEYQASLAGTLNDWALVLLMAGDVAGAGPLFKEAVERQRGALKLEPRRPLYRQFLSSQLAGWADVLEAQGDHAAAVKAAREGLSVQEALASDFPDVPHYRHATAERASDFGRLVTDDDPTAAAASFRQAISLLEAMTGTFADVPARAGLLADCYKDLGLVLDAAGRPEEAAASFRSARKWRPKDPGTLAAFGKHLLKRRQFAEAEPVWRESLKAREEHQPDSWMTFAAKAQLGASLLGQKKYTEAEPLLLAGYEGLKQREATLEGEHREHLTNTAELLVRLYEVRNQPDKAADWRKKLAVPKTPGKKD